MIKPRLIKAVVDIVFCIDSSNVAAMVRCMEPQIMKFVEKHIKLFLWGPKDPVYESFGSLPGSEITLLDGALYSGKIDLTKRLDRILLVQGCFHDSNL